MVFYSIPAPMGGSEGGGPNIWAQPIVWYFTVSQLPWEGLKEVYPISERSKLYGILQYPSSPGKV